MNPFQSIIVFAEFKDLTDTFRQCLLLQMYMLHHFPHSLAHSQIRQSGSKRVHRLHRMKLFLIFACRLKNLRMLHHKRTPPAYHPAPYNDMASGAQCITQKRHPKPQHFQCSGHIFDHGGRRLKFPVRRHLDISVNTAFHSSYRTFLQLTDRYRILIDIIGPRIKTQKISRRIYSQFLKERFRLFSNTLDLSNAGIFIHILYLFTWEKDTF